MRRVFAVDDHEVERELFAKHRQMSQDRLATTLSDDIAAKQNPHALTPDFDRRAIRNDPVKPLIVVGARDGVEFL